MSLRVAYRRVLDRIADGLSAIPSKFAVWTVGPTGYEPFEVEGLQAVLNTLRALRLECGYRGGLFSSSFEA